MWIFRDGNSAGVLRWVTAPPVPFPAAVALSLALHIALALALTWVPRHEAGAPLEVYKVRLVGAPARPEARRLDVAREAPRAAEAAPTPRAAEAALAVPKVNLPGTVVPAQPAPEAAVPNAAAAPALRERARNAPPAPLGPGGPPAQAARETRPAPVLPSAPPLLRPPGAPARAEPAPAEPAPAAQPERAPPAQPAAPPPPSALESLRGIVREQESAAPQGARTAPSPAPSNPLSERARRRYRSGIGTRVRENHTYPADFPCGIETVMSITIGRDGALLASELLQSSGDARYDYAVQLTIRATVFASLPEEIPGNTLQETLRFTPKRCTTSNPQ